MNIYVSTNYKNEPLGIMVAENRDYAEVAFSASFSDHFYTEEALFKGFESLKVSHVITSKPKDLLKGTRKWIRGK